MRRRSASIYAIFITVFVDLLSFGMVIPDLQLRGRALGAEGIMLGLLLGSFSLAQLLTAPYLGRLSDRIGRRKVLLITTALTVVSFVAYAHADSFVFVLIARVLSGIAGANLGVAFAYVADVTGPQDRAKGMGMIGAAFGLGFILGPVFGAFLIRAGDDKPLLLGYVAAAMAAANLVYVWFLLPEPDRHEASDRGPFFSNLRRAFASPALALLLAMVFANNLGFVNLETTYFQLLAHPGFTFAPVIGGDFETAKTIGAYMLAFVGIVGVVMQGFLVRKFVKRFGEHRLLRWSFFVQAPALALTAFAPLWLPHLAVLFAIAFANGLTQPSLSSLVSRNAPRDLQGSVFGVTQALGAVARFAGPLVSNTLFLEHPSYQYLLGAALILFPALAAWRVREAPIVEQESS